VTPPTLEHSAALLAAAESWPNWLVWAASLCVVAHVSVQLGLCLRVIMRRVG